jgi:phosphotriesterase-related protein
MKKGHVMTVLGPIAADSLGPTLPHEHLFCDLSCYWQRPIEATQMTLADAPVTMELLGLIKHNPVLNRDNCRLSDFDLAVSEVMEFRKLGGGTIVDVTLPDIGRDPGALQMVSRVTGINIVAGCGHYTHLAHPPSLDNESIEQITGRLIRELTEGIGETGVRAGVIGEIGTSDPIHPREERVLRAAARAHIATGAAVTVHLHSTSRRGLEVLTILEQEGVNPSRTVVDHVDICTLGQIPFHEAMQYFQALAERGCFVEFDTCGNDSYYAESKYGRGYWAPTDRERAQAIAALFELGFGDQVLISHDVCTKHLLMRYGGFGYGHILRTFGHNLRDFGLGTVELEKLLIENPRRMLVPAS